MKNTQTCHDIPDVTTTTMELNASVMNKVDSLDLHQILLYLVYKKGWEQARAEYAIKWYRRFLYLCLIEPDSALSPTADVDEVWHRHILTMKQYEKDCQMLNGGIIFHNPTLIGEDGEYVQEATGDCDRDCKNCTTDCTTGNAKSFSFEELSSIHFGEVPETTFGFCNKGCNMPAVNGNEKTCDGKACSRSCTKKIEAHTCDTDGGGGNCFR